MRFILVILSILLFSTFSIAQIKQVETPKAELIGEVKVLSDLLIRCEKFGDEYLFTYKDAKYQKIVEFKSFSFKDVDNDFESLYQTILSGLKKPPKDDIKLELPESIVWLHFGKVMGKTYVEFYHSVDKSGIVIGKSTWLNKRKVDKLFGKR